MIKYSLFSTLNPFFTLNGATITQGTKVYAFYEPFVASEAPYSFWDNSVKVGNNESQAPIEVGNGNGWTPDPGTHKLEVKNKNGQVIESATFTVGTVVEPPVPNPTLKTIILKLKSDGSEVCKIQYDETKCERIG